MDAQPSIEAAGRAAKEAHTLVSIQALRAAAAISVVLCHFNQVGLMIVGRPNDPFPLYSLAAGVDVFFVISGFIMVYSSERLFAAPGASLTFMSQRIARIVPLYWATTLIAIPLMSLPVSPATLAGSLLFVPYYAPSGGIIPLHGVGWTLNFEMFFYALFALAVAWRRAVAVSALCIVLVLAALAGYFFNPQSAPLAFWSDPIILEFTLGMALAVIYQRRIVLPDAIWLCLIVAGLVSIWFSASHMPPSGNRLIVWGLPAVAIVAGTVLGTSPSQQGHLGRVVMLFGNASYSIYLIHPLIGAMVIRSGFLMTVFRHLPLAALLLFGALASSAAAIVIYKLFEKPSTRWVRKHLPAFAFSR